jgi:ATP-dependent RNA helicase DDX51/DBP6
MIVCESSRKPLMLFHLVHSNGVNNALVFTKTAESTTRLVQLFEFFEESIASNATGVYKPKTVRAYSSDLAPSERKGILDKFRAQEIDMYVPSTSNTENIPKDVVQSSLLRLDLSWNRYQSCISCRQL